MGLQGAVLFGAVPAYVVRSVVAGPAGTVATVAVLAIAFAVPFGRTVSGKVWVRDGVLRCRNPYRTVRLPVGQIGRFGHRPVGRSWHRIATVGRRGSAGLVGLLPVPWTDTDVLVQRLAAAGHIEMPPPGAPPAA